MNRIGSEQNIQFVSVSFDKFQPQFINQQLDSRILFNHQLEHLSLGRREQEEVRDVQTLTPPSGLSLSIGLPLPNPERALHLCHAAPASPRC